MEFSKELVLGLVTGINWTENKGFFPPHYYKQGQDWP